VNTILEPAQDVFIQSEEGHDLPNEVTITESNDDGHANAAAAQAQRAQDAAEETREAAANAENAAQVATTVVEGVSTTAQQANKAAENASSAAVEANVAAAEAETALSDVQKLTEAIATFPQRLMDALRSNTGPTVTETPTITETTSTAVPEDEAPEPWWRRKIF
jgi:triphosphoribosyl-dephospho-CoA synthetase